MIERIDAASRRWSPPLRWLYLLVKWSLVALGAFGVIGVTVRRWGPYAAAWFLIAPLLWGLWEGRQSAE